MTTEISENWSQNPSNNAEKIDLVRFKDINEFKTALWIQDLDISSIDKKLFDSFAKISFTKWEIEYYNREYYSKWEISDDEKLKTLTILLQQKNWIYPDVYTESRNNRGELVIDINETNLTPESLKKAFTQLDSLGENSPERINNITAILQTYFFSRGFTIYEDNSLFSWKYKVFDKNGVLNDEYSKILSDKLKKEDLKLSIWCIASVWRNWKDMETRIKSIVSEFNTWKKIEDQIDLNNPNIGIVRTQIANSKLSSVDKSLLYNYINNPGLYNVWDNSQINSKIQWQEQRTQAIADDLNKKWNLKLTREDIANGIRNPIWFVNNVLWSMNWLSSLSIIVLWIWAIFWKPLDSKFGKVLAWLAWFWLLQAFGITEEIAKWIKWDYDNKIVDNVEKAVEEAKKAPQWAKNVITKVYSGTKELTDSLIDKVSNWYNFQYIKFKSWVDSKPIYEANFLDMYSSSNGNSTNFDSNLSIDVNWNKQDKVPDENIKKLKSTIYDLYARWLKAFWWIKENFETAINWKNLIEVEAIVDEKEQEKKQTWTEPKKEKWSESKWWISESKNGWEKWHESVKWDDSSDWKAENKSDWWKSIIETAFAKFESYVKVFNNKSENDNLDEFAIILSKIMGITECTKEWLKVIDVKIENFKKNDDYQKLTDEARKTIDSNLELLRKNYEKQVKKSLNETLDSFVKVVLLGKDKVEDYLKSFKSQFNNLSSYTAEWLEELNERIKKLKDDPNFSKLDTKIQAQINTMLIEVQKQYEEKFKNIITIFGGEKLDLDNLESKKIDDLFSSKKDYSIKEFEWLKMTINWYKISEKFTSIKEEDKKNKISDFLDSIVDKYEKILLNQEKESFKKKLEDSKKNLFNTFSDSTELRELINAKIDSLNNLAVNSANVNDVLMISYNYKFFTDKIDEYLSEITIDYNADWILVDNTNFVYRNIIRFISDYKFDDLWLYRDIDLLKIIKTYNLLWDDSNDSERIVNPVFIKLKDKISELLNWIIVTDDEMFKLMYMKYLNYELNNNLDSLPKWPFIRINNDDIENLNLLSYSNWKEYITKK